MDKQQCIQTKKHTTSASQANASKTALNDSYKLNHFLFLKKILQNGESTIGYRLSFNEVPDILASSIFPKKTVEQFAQITERQKLTPNPKSPHLFLQIVNNFTGNIHARSSLNAL